MYADQARPFGFFSAALVCGIGIWLAWTGGAHAGYWISAAGMLAAITAIYPRVWLGVLRVWMPVAHLLGRINTYFLLGAVFFLMIVPMGLMVRLFKHDPLRLRGLHDDSAWIRRDQPYTPDSFKEPF